MSDNKNRVYFVIDMKSFFASVECAERGLNAMTTKLVVADETRTEKTICLAVSPALKALGVKNRCRLFEIPKNIDYIIAPPRMRKYITYAAEIYGIYLKYISKEDIHVYSIDECIIDATDYLKLYKLRAKEFVNKLIAEIWQTLGIPASAGIGSNMYLAKIALDITAKKSPDRIGWLTEEKFIKTLWEHRPITDFWGISSGTEERLKTLGIFDMKGIAEANEDALYRVFGVNAELLIDHAYGREPCLMSDIKSYKGRSKSFSSSQILPCNYTAEDALTVLKEMLQNGCYDLFARHYSTSLLHVYAVYGTGRKETVKATARMVETTNLYSVMAPYAENAYRSAVNFSKPVRRVGYDFAEVVPESDERYDFFTDMSKVDKEKRLVSGILKVKEKFGKNAIFKGIDLTEKATQRERNETVGGHRGGES